MKANTKGSKGFKLQTQKDGRRFAISLLKRIEKIDAGQFSSYRALRGQGITRKGPQSDVILRAFERVMHFGRSPAILGFFCVMTDYIGTARDGHVYPETFEKWERQGCLQHWQLPMRDLSKEAHHARG